MDRKWTHMMFAAGGIIIAWLLAKVGDWVWGYFGRPNGFVLGAAAFALAGVITVTLWRNQELFELATEVQGELRKVTWPTRKETVAATMVVIVMVIISSLILGVFDGTWAWVTRQIYG
jgi:preprotein translocase subunit SecE